MASLFTTPGKRTTWTTAASTPGRVKSNDVLSSLPFFFTNNPGQYREGKRRKVLFKTLLFIVFILRMQFFFFFEGGNTYAISQTLNKL